MIGWDCIVPAAIRVVVQRNVAVWGVVEATGERWDGADSSGMPCAIPVSTFIVQSR